MSLPLGREVQLKACGRTWIVSSMSLDVLDKFLDWLRPQLPDPFAGLEKFLPYLSKEDVKAELERARANRILDYSSPAVREALMIPRARLALFLIMLLEHQPEATVEDAAAIVKEIGGERLTALFGDTAGKMPEGKAEAPAEPEAKPLTGGSSAGASLVPGSTVPL